MTAAIWITAIIFIALVTLSVWLTWDNRQPAVDGPDDLQIVKADYERALDAYHNADPDYIDVAIANLEAAESRRDIVIQRLREGR